MEREDRIESKIDKVIEHISAIDQTLAAQHESLKIHIKRTDLLEKQTEKLNEHRAKQEGALRLLAFTGTALMLAKFVMRLF